MQTVTYFVVSGHGTAVALSFRLCAANQYTFIILVHVFYSIKIFLLEMWYVYLEFISLSVSLKLF